MINKIKNLKLKIFKKERGFTLHFPGLIKSEGFTLIELIVVFAILGIMATAALALLDPAAQFKKASDSRRKSDLSQIQKAIETYYQDMGKYPASTIDYKITGLDGKAVTWGSSWSPYMNPTPKDPSSSRSYIYYSPSGGQTYYLYANLERGTDPQACNGGNACTSLSSNGISLSACGGTGCNYGVSSPNVSP